MAISLDHEMFKYPSTKNREPGKYADVKIISCEHKSWWYHDIVGEEVFCKLYFKDWGYGEQLEECIPVRLTNTKIEEFRKLKASDCIIL